MAEKKGLFILTNIFLLLVIVGFASWVVLAAPSVTYTFEGKVLEGSQGEYTRPLHGVDLGLFGVMGPYPYPPYNPGDEILLNETQTNLLGEFSLSVTSGISGFSSYKLKATDFSEYSSVAAVSTAGTVIDANTIEFLPPLDGKDLTGNTYWDKAPMMSGNVYDGYSGDFSRPLPGALVSLYCTNEPLDPYPGPGELIDDVLTDINGAYELSIYVPDGVCDVYDLIQTDLPGYQSTAAESTGGAVITENWIQYIGPYLSATWIGNNFWDISHRIHLPLVIK